ncbi:hypothetical protein CWI39_0120p0020 [Hamiltosporidium magnivora]|nr:hypothetical protein CWI39_0120p0020 [Hamiltosporidium magnivora]
MKELETILILFMLNSGMINASDSDLRSQIGLPLPLFVERYPTIFDINCIMFVLFNILFFVVALLPQDKLEKFQKSLVAGIGAFYTVYHLSGFLPLIKIFSRLGSLAAAVVVAVASYMNKDLCNLGLSIPSGYIAGYMTIAIIRSFGFFGFLFLFAIYTGIFFLLGKFREKEHYGACRGLILTYCFLVITSLLTPLSIFRSVHGLLWAGVFIIDIIGLLILISMPPAIFMYTVFKSKVLEVVLGKKDNKPQQKENSEA